MSGNDFSRCEQCGAVWLDEPKPCGCLSDDEKRIAELEAENKRLREALDDAMMSLLILGATDDLPIIIKLKQALKETP